MTKPLPRIDGKGVLDMHVHVGPEFLMRRYSPASLAEEARRSGIGVVMKNHFQPTTGWVAMLRREDDAVDLVGSVTLNLGSGGIDEHGVRSALSGWKSDVGRPDPDPRPFVVWMPTLATEAHLAIMDRRDIPLSWSVQERHTRLVSEGEGLRLHDDAARPAPGLARLLAIVAAHDLVLATGHLGHDEVIAFVKLAHEAGVRRIVVTHPLFQATKFAPETLAHLWTAYGAYSELCYVNLAMDHLTIAQYRAVVDAVGPEGCILSSDLGQPFSPAITEGWVDYVAQLEAGGVSPDDIARMAILNPRTLLAAA